MPTVSQHYARRGALFAAAADESPAPVLLMVSGGADSTALLVMACTGRLDIADGRGSARIARERLHVLHVNHHLRGEASDADERHVRSLCEDFGVPLFVEHASFVQLDGQNLEAAAREVRYAAARRCVRELSRKAGSAQSAARILTAHTASDRTETFFMNAIKGSGPAGLSSIPRRRNIIVRPLLDKTHEELCAYLEVAGVPWREDETNADTSYLRNFVRHRVVPLAAERNDNLVRAIGASCDILGDEDAFMSQLAATALRTCIRRRDEGLLVIDAARLAAAEVAVARRMVRLAVKQLDPEVRLEMHHVEAVLSCVAAGSGSTTLPARIDARVEFGTLSLRTAAARETLTAGWLGVPGRMPLANQRVLQSEMLVIPRGADPVAMAREVSGGSEPAVLVDAASLGYAERELEGYAGLGRDVPAEARAARFWVDGPAPGDLMCPLGMSGRSKKISDLLNERHVPVAERPGVPVVRTAPGGLVVWVAGVRLDERFKCTAQTRVGIKLSMRDVAGLSE